MANDNAYLLSLFSLSLLLVFFEVDSLEIRIFYLAFAYIQRSHEIASHVTSSSVRVSISS